jgi:hypothetical protein
VDVEQSAAALERDGRSIHRVEMRIDGTWIHAVEIIPDLLAGMARNLLDVLGRIPRQLAFELHRLKRLNTDIQWTRSGKLGDVVRVLIDARTREEVAAPGCADGKGGTQQELERVSHG